ncbi:MAG: PAS domain S-box protein [Verrucomicrobiota bacterium]
MIIPTEPVGSIPRPLNKRGIQNALRESEQRLRAMFNQAAVGMAIAGMDGRFEEVNQKFSDILDYSAEELSALTFLEVTYPTDLPQTEKEMGRLLAGEITDYSLEKRYIRKDGAIVWVFCTVTLLRDEAGVPNRFVGVIEDISQRKKTEERLRSSEEELRALADSIPQLAWVAEPDGNIFWYNKRWFDYTGTTLPQMEGWGWQSVHDPEKLPLVLERWRASISSGEPFEMEFPLRGADGVFRWFLTRVIPVRNAEGHITRWFGTNTDLDEIRKTRQELQKAKDELEDRVRERTASLQETTQQLETFCYTIAHDLRSPLRAQQGFALALLDEYQEALGETGKDYVQRIIAASKRQDQLVNDLLSYSRLSRTDLHFEKVDLAKVVQDVQAIFAEEIAHKNASISIGELAPVLAHEATLNIIVSNLITNALKFMAPGVVPRIRIWADQKNTFVRLWVEDNGIGINVEHQPRIFGVFQRLHPMDAYPGTGIGLALVQKGVERMGGSVGLESAPGEGSRFWIELPHAP